jgi:hypothetical protein
MAETVTLQIPEALYQRLAIRILLETFRKLDPPMRNKNIGVKS